MNVIGALLGIRRYVDAFGAALDYDPYTDIRLRIERLEQQSDGPRREDAGTPPSRKRRLLQD